MTRSRRLCVGSIATRNGMTLLKTPMCERISLVRPGTATPSTTSREPLMPLNSTATSPNNTLPGRTLPSAHVSKKR